MNPIITGIVGLIVLFLLIALTVPIGFAMLIVGFCGTLSLIGLTATIHSVSEVTFGIISNFDFCVLPLFIFMSSICFFAGLGEKLFKFTNNLLGHFRGGLAMATIGSCALFAAASASTIATALTIGKVAVPEMKKYNYSSILACSATAAGGVLGVLIPPSGIMILYGIITGESIAKLFIGGIIPGVILALFFIGTIIIWVRFNPDLAPSVKRTSLSIYEKFKSFLDCGEMMILIIILIIGILFGWFTPTEAGGIGALGAVLFSTIRSLLSFGKIKEAILDTLRTTGMLFTLLIGALVMNTFLTLSTIPQELSNYISNMKLPPYTIILLIILMYVILGCIMDSLSMIFLTIPIIFPLVKSLGFHPIWFGVVITILFELAVLTPPIGVNVFVISTLDKDIPIEKIFRGIIPFIFPILVVIFLVLIFPGLVLFLPSKM